MAIKTLTPWGPYPAGAIITTLDANTEASMVTQGVATTNLTGGTAYSPSDNLPAWAEADLNRSQLAAGAVGCVGQVPGAGGEMGVISYEQLTSVKAMVTGYWILDPETGRFYVGPDPATQSPVVQAIVKSDTWPSADFLSLSTMELKHDGSQGYILHLTQGANMGASAALIGLGIDEGGRGLFVNNKKTGVGVVITQNSTITSPTAYGMLVNGGKGAAPAVFMQQNNDDASLNAQSLLVMHAYRSFSSSQKIMEWRKPDGTTSGTLAGWIRAEDGALIVQDAPAIVSGADLTVQPNGATGGNLSALTLTATGAGAVVSLYNSSGTANKRQFRWSVSSDIFVLSGRNDAGGSTGDLLYAQNTTKNIGLCGGASFGGGSGVVAVPNAATVPSTNPSAGGVLYSEGGALKWRGSSGTITTIAAA